MHMTDLIEKKKTGGEFTEEEIRFIIWGYTAGEIPDYQMSSLTNDMPFHQLYFQGCKDAMFHVPRALHSCPVFKHTV